MSQKACLCALNSTGRNEECRVSDRLDSLFDSLDHHVERVVGDRNVMQAHLDAALHENAQLKTRLEMLEARLASVIEQVRAVAAPASAGHISSESASEPVLEQAMPAPAPSIDYSISDSSDTKDTMPSAPQTAPEQPIATPSPSELLAQWYERYPNTFFKAHTRPLQIGIHQALAEAEPWSGKLIRRALACYVNLPRYMKSMREGVERVDLSGSDAGQVTGEEVQHAREQLKQMQARQRAQEAKRQQDRMSSKLDALQRQHQH